MRLLLDTNALIWMLMGSSEIPQEMRDRIEGDIGSVMVSSISLAEIAIKVAIRKLTVTDDFAPTVAAIGFAPLAFTVRHAERMQRLPLLHRDPFDRMLVAQALSEDVPLVTRDTVLSRYGVEVLRV